MQPYPRALDLVWPGQLHGTGCLSARALDTGFPTVVWCLCLGPGCGWLWVSVTPPVLAGVLGGCVWVRFVVSSLFCRLGFVVFVVGLGFRPAPYLSWLGIWDARGCVRAPPAPRRFRFRCVVWACVLGSGFRLRPATPWGGVGVFVCSCARPAWSPASPGWGCCAGVCVGARALLNPRLCWLGCAVWACVLGPGLGCAALFLVELSGCVFFFACLALALWCWSLAVPVPGLVVLSSHPLSFGLGCWVFFFFFVPAWCVSARFECPFPRWAAAPGLVLPVLAGWSPCAPLGVLSSVPSGWGVWPPLVVLAGGLVAGGHSLAPPPSPMFFFGGRVCLFLHLPSLGWRTHWPAFSVVFRVAIGGCVLLGRVPAPWVGWVMYTLGSAPLPAGLGPGSAGWAAAPGGFVWLWARGLGLPVSFLLRGAGFNLLGGPPPLLPGARWPRVWPAVPVCGVLVRRLPGCAVACFG